MQDSKIKRIINKILLIILVIIVLYNVIFVIGNEINNKFNIKLFGKQAVILKETSMKEEISNKDIIILKKTREIKENDIIAFYENDTLKIRRVVQIKKDKLKWKYVTKGDNYLYNDPEEITIGKIEGKVVKVIKHFGFVLKILQSKIFMMINTLILILILWRNKKIEDRRKMRRKRRENK